MHVAARVDHAISAALVLPEPSDPPVAGAVLADELGLSYPYLMTIIDPLKKAGLARVRRGPQGGLSLARRSDDITLADVIWAVDAPTATSPPHDRGRDRGPERRGRAAATVGHRPRRRLRGLLPGPARSDACVGLDAQVERDTGCS